MGSGSCIEVLEHSGARYTAFAEHSQGLHAGRMLDGVRDATCDEVGEQVVGALEVVGVSPALAFIGPNGDIFARVGTLPQLRSHPIGAGIRERRFSMALLRKSCRRPVRFRGRLVDAGFGKKHVSEALQDIADVLESSGGFVG